MALEAESVTVAGKELFCSFCDNNKFFEFDVRLNTFSSTFGSGLWSFLAKKAKAYACSKCGLKQEFVQK